jgi:hypothetical protein
VATRPELLGGVARQTHHAGQTRISVTLSHAKSAKIKTQLAEASAFLQSLLTTAEQLTNTQFWERILLRIFEKFISPKTLHPSSYRLRPRADQPLFNPQLPDLFF